MAVSSKLCQKSNSKNWDVPFEYTDQWQGHCWWPWQAHQPQWCSSGVYNLNSLKCIRKILPSLYRYKGSFSATSISPQIPLQAGTPHWSGRMAPVFPKSNGKLTKTALRKDYIKRNLLLKAKASLTPPNVLLEHKEQILFQGNVGRGLNV